jgi:hypothetical protein
MLLASRGLFLEDLIAVSNVFLWRYNTLTISNLR